MKYSIQCKDNMNRFSENCNNKIILGVDEVGRGSLIGEVFVCSILLGDKANIQSVDDSKKLTKAQRESIFDAIIKDSICTVAFGTLKQIEKKNILHATLDTMKRSATELRRIVLEKDKESIRDTLHIKLIQENIENEKTMTFGNPAILDEICDDKFVFLIDGNKEPSINLDKVQTVTQVKGDSKFYEIAAASIVAKVARDLYIEKVLHPKHPQYHWDLNFGYATKKHIAAIQKNGSTDLHRKGFKVKALELNVPKQEEFAF
ncbi:ribonuclease HII [Rickettsiales bacterium]|nr:ribonuclease HII [Rickettsiales bacterium]